MRKTAIPSDNRKLQDVNLLRGNMQPTVTAHEPEHFDSCFQIIASFMDALQKNFKEDTHYAYPLMPPQANILYVLDADVAQNMKTYMIALITNSCGFTESDFRFTERSAGDAGGLFRLRFEFIHGITFDMIHRILEQTTMLEERVLQRRMAQ